MNRLLQEKWPWIEGSHGMRTQLLDVLSDADLAFSPGGRNITLGALFREMAETEYSYIQSLKTLKQDWTSSSTNASMETSLDRIKAEYQALDDEMKATISALSDEDTAKTVDRGGGFSMPLDLQLDVYLQALLIFFGKATVYLRAMNRAYPEQIQAWIGSLISNTSWYSFHFLQTVVPRTKVCKKWKEYQDVYLLFMLVA